jgi:20S proteasome alpha/beta subunit
MTICIATICEKKYVVVATDKMLTLTLPSIEYEADYPKTIEVTPNCIATTAGSAIAYTPIFHEVRGELVKQASNDVARIAELTRIAYGNVRNNKLSEEILSTYGLNLQAFYQINTSINANLMAIILQRMQQYNYGLWIMMAGVDEAGGHIHRIENPSIKNCFDAIGYHAIGSGDIHAVDTFIANNYEVKNTTLQRGLALTYEAKKRSEKAQGVGEQTDMYVVSKEKTWHLPEEAITKLDEVYRKRVEQEKKVFLDMEQMISSLDIEEKYLKQ